MSKQMELALTLKARDEMSQPVGQAMRTLTKESQQAKDAVIGISRESKRLADARQTLGIRSERTIQREVRQTELAYQRLSRSAVLSSREQARAYEAMQRRVAGLRRELAGVNEQQRNWGAGARNLMAAGTGIAAGAYVVSQPVKRTMDYDRRLATMANTAFAERDLGGRQAGMRELSDAIKTAVRYGGGSREGAAETLDNLLASGAIRQATAVKLLPTLQRASTASGADPNALGNIAIRAMQTFDIQEGQLPLVLDMAIKAGQAGGFELKDMSRWLPQQMAAAKQSGMSGMGGIAKLLAVNQAAAITAGTKDEAGNNVLNLLAKINSIDTAKDAAKLSATTFKEKSSKKEKGIDLSGRLASDRAKGIDALDSFVGLVEQVVASDSRYQAIQAQLKTASGPERKSLLEAQGNILQGSAIGRLIQDRQALMALVGYMGNRDYAQGIEKQLPNAQGTAQANFALIEGTAAYQLERAQNEKAFAESAAFGGLSKTVGDVSGALADYAQRYPALSAALVGATTALGAMAAAAGAAAFPLLLLSKAGGAGTAAGTATGAAASGGKGVAARVAASGAAALALPVAVGVGYGSALVSVASAITDEDRQNATRRQTSSRFGKDLTQRNQPSAAAPIPQAGASGMSPAMNVAPAPAAPIPIRVTVDVKNGNIVAAVNEANSQQARRQ